MIEIKIVNGKVQIDEEKKYKSCTSYSVKQLEVMIANEQKKKDNIEKYITKLNDLLKYAKDNDLK